MSNEKKVQFQTLWSNYPRRDPCIDPKTGEAPKGFENQCAIRLGTALEKSGISFRSFRGNVCPVPKSHPSMAASAQQLANWLKKRPFEGCPAVENFTGSSVFSAIKDRPGIIFLANYWQRDREKGSQRRSGDHIDLWNGSRMSTMISWFRVHWAVSIDGVYSDYRIASIALFWHIP